ncbi:MAG TPA: flagellar motor protein MotB [Bryobacteraceae bacterium]|nr:flagellar motor protein MotB [Bryobacteraceae bacterium]
MARKKHEEHENHERWLVSYADFITLLFAFFVVMFATSQTDKAKAQQVSDSVKKALEGESFKSVVSVILGGAIDNKGQGNAQRRGPGGAVASTVPTKRTPEPSNAQVAELLPSLTVLSKELEQEIKSGKLQLSMGARGLTISFTQAALFPSGEDVIAPDTVKTIRKIAVAVNQIPNPVRLEGHTDAVPIHNAHFRSNWELSAARSIALLELLTSMDVSKDRLSIAGYADTAPVDDNQTEEGRQKNRRVDIIILNQTGVKGEPDRPAPAAASKGPEPAKPAGSAKPGDSAKH